MLRWIYNPGRFRFEQQLTDDKTGQSRVLRTAFAPGSDQTDVLPSVWQEAVPQSAVAAMRAYDPNNPATTSAITTMWSGLTEALGKDIQSGSVDPTTGATRTAQTGAAGDTQTGQPHMGGIRSSVDQINANLHSVNTVLDHQERVNQLAAAEHKLRSDLTKAGINADDLFGNFTASGPFQPAGAAGAAATQQGTSGVPAAGPGVALDPEYQNAYTDVSATALRADLQSRTERLQQIGEAADARMTGADRLQKLQDATKARDAAQAQYDWDEKVASSNAANDKHIKQMLDNSWSHDPAAHGNLQAHKQNVDAMMRTWWPDQWQRQVKEKQRDYIRNGGKVEGYQNWNLDDEGNDLPDPATGVVTQDPRERYNKKTQTFGPAPTAPPPPPDPLLGGVGFAEGGMYQGIPRMFDGGSVFGTSASQTQPAQTFGNTTPTPPPASATPPPSTFVPSPGGLLPPPQPGSPYLPPVGNVTQPYSDTLIPPPTAPADPGAARAQALQQLQDAQQRRMSQLAADKASTMSQLSNEAAQQVGQIEHARDLALNKVEGDRTMALAKIQGDRVMGLNKVAEDLVNAEQAEASRVASAKAGTGRRQEGSAQAGGFAQTAAGVVAGQGALIPFGGSGGYATNPRPAFAG